MKDQIETIEPPLPRAGFWRRAIAFFIDCAIVMVPISLLAGILFSVTDGRVYMSSPFLKYSYCAPQASYPSTLRPAPPVDSNFASTCKIYTFTGTTANFLIVGQRKIDGSITRTTSYSYELNRQNQPIEGFGIDLSWIGEVFAVLMIISMQSIYGRSFGQMALSTRISYLNDISRIKIPISKLILRYFFAFVFPLVFFIPLLVWFFLPFTAAVVVTVFFCVVPGAYWIIGNIGLIVQRKDPWFDRWSGIAEIKMYPNKAITPPLIPPAMPPPLPRP